jgi:hypothetical protein
MRQLATHSISGIDLWLRPALPHRDLRGFELPCRSMIKSVDQSVDQGFSRSRIQSFKDSVVQGWIGRGTVSHSLRRYGWMAIDSILTISQYCNFVCFQPVMGIPSNKFFLAYEVPLVRCVTFHCYIDFSGSSNSGHSTSSTSGPLHALGPLNHGRGGRLSRGLQRRTAH